MGVFLGVRLYEASISWGCISYLWSLFEGEYLVTRCLESNLKSVIYDHSGVRVCVPSARIALPNRTRESVSFGQEGV